MIFSFLSGVPCLAIDNRNKKVSGALEEVDSSAPIHVIQSDEFEDIPVLIEKLFKKAKKTDSWKLEIDIMYSELWKLLK